MADPLDDYRPHRLAAQLGERDVGVLRCRCGTDDGEQDHHASTTSWTVATRWLSAPITQGAAFVTDEIDVEVVIVGGGLAGLSAALVLARARRRVVVVDDQQPRNRKAARAHGFITRDGVRPVELLRLARAECAGYGVRFVDGAVARVAAGFQVTAIDGMRVIT